MTKRSIAVLACIAVLALPAAAGAGRPSRTETGNYTAGGIQGVLGLTVEGHENVGAVRLSGGRERYVSVEVADATGRPVAGEVAQNLDSDDAPEVSYDFCGGTGETVKVKPGEEVIVYLYAGTCGGGPSAPTTGRVTAEFSTAL